ncbi:MAG TPA: class III extradiol ring-cleavage dioxygenase [Pyrinomonadaceae bacterium]|jgi:4,5-DOPA dioxygenase extradiol
MNTENLPSLFVSHGAPTLALERNDTVTFLRSLGARIERPRSILCVSAHWTTAVPMLSAAPQPETIHDFGGFPASLYRMRYDAPGAPGLAARAASLLDEAGIEAQVSPRRGLDHGAWIPLILMYPEADIPVTQLSVQAEGGPSANLQVGRALAPLRGEGVLILATGGAVHNLSRIAGEGSPPPDWAVQFDEWLHRQLTEGTYEELIDYRRLAPYSALAHPTEEHLLPLFVAMGTAGGSGSAAHQPDDKPRAASLHRGWTHGSLSMAAYGFGVT